MLPMAKCAHCDHEFYPDDDAGAGRVHCPACGAVVILPETGDATSDAKIEVTAAADAPSTSESTDTASRRIEKWFHSAETVDDMPIGNIGYPIDAEFRHSETDTPPEIPPADDDHQTYEGGTVEFDSDSKLAHAGDADNEITLEAPVELTAQPSATWEDSERIERLLADIEAKQNNDYLPVAREDRDLAGDETLEDTSQYQAAPDTSPKYDTTWNRRAKAGEAALVGTIFGTHVRRRHSTLLRTLVSTLLAGILGLVVGCYALMWWYGPTGDLLKIAPYVPKSLLPSSFKEDDPSFANKLPKTSTPTNANKSGNNTPTTSDSRDVTASFETPVTSTNAAAQTPTEPARFDEKAAALFFPPAVEVKSAPIYSVEQFNVALRAARDASPGLVAGNLDDRTVQRTKGASYNKLCDLAETATFVDGAGNSPAAIDSLRRDAENLFREALVEARIRGEIARIAPVWIGSLSRKHGGVFFAGDIQRRSERGSVTECQIATGSGEPLTILVPPSLVDRLAAFRRSFVVVGSIIDRPADRIVGYDGVARQAVWVSSLIPLDQ